MVILSVDDGRSEMVAWLVRQTGINFPVLMAGKTTTRNFSDVAAILTSFLGQNNGQVVKKYSGHAPQVLLERDIESVR